MDKGKEVYPLHSETQIPYMQMFFPPWGVLGLNFEND